MIISNSKTCVLVCGGHDFDNRVQLAETLDCLHQERGFSRVIAGGTHGAAKLAGEWAEIRSLACEVYHTDWLRIGRDAYRVRNELMLAEGKPELVVAFPGGPYTAHMLGIVRDAGVELIEAAAPRRLFAPFPLWSSNWRASGFRWRF